MKRPGFLSLNTGIATYFSVYLQYWIYKICPLVQDWCWVTDRRTDVISPFVKKIRRDREACLSRVDTRFVCPAVVTHAHRWLHSGCRLLTEEHVEYMQKFLPSKVRHFFVFVGCCGIQVSGMKGQNNRSVRHYVHCINFRQLYIITYLPFARHCSWTAGPLKMGRIGCAEKFLNNYQHALHNIPEDRNPQLNLSGKLKSHLSR